MKVTVQSKKKRGREGERERKRKGSEGGSLAFPVQIKSSAKKRGIKLKKTFQLCAPSYLICY